MYQALIIYLLLLVPLTEYKREKKRELNLPISPSTFALIFMYADSKRVVEIVFLDGAQYEGRRKEKKLFHFLFSTRLKGAPLE